MYLSVGVSLINIYIDIPSFVLYHMVVVDLSPCFFVDKLIEGDYEEIYFGKWEENVC